MFSYLMCRPYIELYKQEVKTLVMLGKKTCLLSLNEGISYIIQPNWECLLHSVAHENIPVRSYNIHSNVDISNEYSSLNLICK